MPIPKSWTFDLLHWESCKRPDVDVYAMYGVARIPQGAPVTYGRVIRGQYVGSVTGAASLDELIGCLVMNAKCCNVQGSVTVRNIWWVEPEYGLSGGTSGMTKHDFEKAAAAAGFPNLKSALVLE